jgi:uncharacterized protein YxjI
MEIKIECGCGTKYKFDVEPVNGRMPIGIVCPNCGASGITEANYQISQKLGSTPPAFSPPPAATPPPPPAPAPASSLRLNREAAEAPAPAEQFSRRGNALLDRNIFFVKEHVALLKLTDTYDIFDPHTNQLIGVCKEEPPVWAKWLRLAVKKHQMPTVINIYEVEGMPPVASIKRGFTFIRSKIDVISGDGRKLGYFKSKLFSIGGGFHVYDHSDQKIAEVKGNWKGWDFTLIDMNGREIGKVTKKWAGLGKELFTSADNYMISLTGGVSNQDSAALLLAASLAVDVVYKEAE